MPESWTSGKKLYKFLFSLFFVVPEKVFTKVFVSLKRYKQQFRKRYKFPEINTKL